MPLQVCVWRLEGKLVKSGLSFTLTQVPGAELRGPGLYRKHFCSLRYLTAPQTLTYYLWRVDVSVLGGDTQKCLQCSQLWTREQEPRNRLTTPIVEPEPGERTGQLQTQPRLRHTAYPSPFLD